MPVVPIETGEIGFDFEPRPNSGPVGTFGLFGDRSASLAREAEKLGSIWMGESFPGSAGPRLALMLSIGSQFARAVGPRSVWPRSRTNGGFLGSVDLSLEAIGDLVINRRLAGHYLYSVRAGLVSDRILPTSSLCGPREYGRSQGYAPTNTKVSRV